MSKYVPRVRMFAGPNGSGKSTIKTVLAPELLYVYINPDEIEIEIRETGFFDIGSRRASCTLEDVQAFFGESGLTKRRALSERFLALDWREARSTSAK